MSEALNEEALDIPTGARRSSQRQPLACRSCTKSKVRCDKKIPCARCSKRNKPCERESVILSHKTSRKSVSARTNNMASIQDQTHPSVAPLNPAEMDDASRHVSVQRRNNEMLTNTEGYRPSISPRSGQGQLPDSLQIEFEDLATCIEGLAWGRHQCHNYPHRNCLRFETQNICSPSALLMVSPIDELPIVSTARQLVEFHLRMLAWNHNVLHAPTFLAQCEEFWSSGSVEDPQWLALYCAVLGSSAWSLNNSSKGSAMARGSYNNHSPSYLLDLTNIILSKEDFMGRHTVFSLQAICIAGMTANVLGKSDMLITWISASIRVAQCLGLHHVGVDIPGQSWSETIDKEVGRRIWWKLVELDYHSIPYTGTYSINMNHFTTQQPRNCNDNDLRHHGEETLTSSTYAILKSRMALLIPEMLEGPGQDATSRYEHVVSVDGKMRRLVASIPHAILRSEDNRESKPEWLVLARRTLAIAAADKIIMIHRSFLVRSFQSPAYLFTRQTCVSAAMTILREHEEIFLAGPTCPPIWVHSAFCVAAIVVICLELLYCYASMTAQRKDHYFTLISAARTRLDTSKNDTMARRGVYLVDAMLNEELYQTTGPNTSD